MLKKLVIGKNDPLIDEWIKKLGNIHIQWNTQFSSVQLLSCV